MRIGLSGTEQRLINVYTPVKYALCLGFVPYESIERENRVDYLRLVRHMIRNNGIDQWEARAYHTSLCGLTLMGIAYLRKAGLFEKKNKK